QKASLGSGSRIPGHRRGDRRGRITRCSGTSKCGEIRSSEDLRRSSSKLCIPRAVRSGRIGDRPENHHPQQKGNAGLWRSTMKLTKQETRIRQSVERGEWKSSRPRTTKYVAAAKATLRKNRRINIRINEADL